MFLGNPLDGGKAFGNGGDSFCFDRLVPMLENAGDQGEGIAIERADQFKGFTMIKGR